MNFKVTKNLGTVSGTTVVLHIENGLVRTSLLLFMRCPGQVCRSWWNIICLRPKRMHRCGRFSFREMMKQMGMRVGARISKPSMYIYLCQLIRT